MVEHWGYCLSPRMDHVVIVVESAVRRLSSEETLQPA
jgi:hypothetical protein